MGTGLRAGMPIDGEMARWSAASVGQRPPVVIEPGYKTDKPGGRSSPSPDASHWIAVLGGGTT